jgi:hypothetical protein
MRHVEHVQEQPAVGVVVDHIKLLEVSEFAISEPLSALVVRVELEGRRAEQEVDPWPGSEAPEVQFSPQSHRASPGKYRHYFRVSQQLSFQ